MRLFWRRDCPAEVVTGLYGLMREFPECQNVVEGGLIYATMGRERRKLTMDWVAKYREMCVEQQLRRWSQP